MQIIEISLENWMIFGGTQKIKLATGPENISIIFGENMHGKTSLLNAIRWCLYGSALNRQGKIIPTKDLINILALQRNETKLSVSLTFQVDSSTFELFRQLDFSGALPVANKSLKIQGRMIDGGKIDSEIENILPEQISQFMLFDGELLRNFENLVVAVGSSQATGIKNAIEETLGIPILRRAYEQAKLLARDFKKESKKELEKNAKSRMISNKIDELELMRQTREAENLEISETLSTLRSELSELAENLHDSQEAIKIIETRKGYEDNSRRIKEQRQNIQTELKKLSTNLWMVPLRQAIASRIEKYSEQLATVKEQAAVQSSKTIQVLKLQRSLEHQNCPTCGTHLSESQAQQMKSELDGLQDELILAGNTEELTFDLKIKIKELQLGPKVKDETEKYKLFLEQDRQLDRDLLVLENKIYEIKQKLKGVDEQTSLTTRNKYDAVNKEIGILEADVQKLDKDISDYEDQIRIIRKSKDFEDLSNSSDIVLRTEKVEQIRDVLSRGISLYRDEMRSSVERRATETFKQLTTEKTFDRLEINESYGLNLIVDNTKVNRSAGAEQIVAMSLIEALNFHGRRTGPMIMDTPVGRLDQKHRSNILNYLPRVVTQLAIFAHSGELEEGNNLIDPRLIGARYRIERASTFHAEIVRI